MAEHATLNNEANERGWTRIKFSFRIASGYADQGFAGLFHVR